MFCWIRDLWQLLTSISSILFHLHAQTPLVHDPQSTLTPGGPSPIAPGGAGEAVLEEHPDDRLGSGWSLGRRLCAQPVGSGPMQLAQGG